MKSTSAKNRTLNIKHVNIKSNKTVQEMDEVIFQSEYTDIRAFLDDKQKYVFMMVTLSKLEYLNS